MSDTCHDNYEKHALSLGKIIHFADYPWPHISSRAWGFVVVGILIFGGISLLSLLFLFPLKESFLFGCFGGFMVYFGGLLIFSRDKCWLFCENGVLIFHENVLIGRQEEDCFLYKELSGFDITGIDHYYSGPDTHHRTKYVGKGWDIVFTLYTDPAEISYYSNSEDFVNTIHDILVNSYWEKKVREFLNHGEFIMGDCIRIQKDGVRFDSLVTIKYDQLSWGIIEEYFEKKTASFDGNSKRSGYAKYLRI